MNTLDLDAIQIRADADRIHFATGNAIQLDDSKDRDYLLALVREQAAKLDRVRGLADYLDGLASDDKHYAILIRATLELKP